MIYALQVKLPTDLFGTGEWKKIAVCGNQESLKIWIEPGEEWRIAEDEQDEQKDKS